ncbi:hypothetical protein N7509_002115 [Penicillium cosmopolitanum]|uniref:Uncharacterized protein n=1 Tax=Penicillium cosmopolitanum TaxID=1131564 RepID=A0A9W9W8F1_9EURO|nr:uncharacterized protein N7509_002115 [Penicillium cosmopolitanum]KAJ5408232.1 hypothetical protein N7509_002115 [Penicillium cosmopolitanum]
MLGRAYFGLDHDPTLNGVKPNSLKSRGGAAQATSTTLGLGIQSFLLGPSWASQEEPRTALPEILRCVCNVVAQGTESDLESGRRPKGPGRSDHSVGCGGNPPQKVHCISTSWMWEGGNWIQHLLNGPTLIGAGRNKRVRARVDSKGEENCPIGGSEIAKNGPMWKLEARETKQARSEGAKDPLPAVTGIKCRPIKISTMTIFCDLLYAIWPEATAVPIDLHR